MVLKENEKAETENIRKYYILLHYFIINSSDWNDSKARFEVALRSALLKAEILNIITIIIYCHIILHIVYCMYCIYE